MPILFRGYREEGGQSIKRMVDNFSFAVSWKDLSFMTSVLVVLNLLDTISSFYAVNVLGFIELNPVTAGFPIWIILLKFAACFIPTVSAYVLHKIDMEKYLLLPIVFSAILIEFYAFVIAFNVRSIFGG